MLYFAIENGTMVTRREAEKRRLKRPFLEALLLLLAVLLFATDGVARQQSRASQEQAVPPAAVSPTAASRVSEVWPAGQEFQRLDQIGRGKGIVFSPDFSAPGNREFYEKLGFAYFEDARWLNVIQQIRRHNTLSDNRIETLILETHGTNGHGLKLQQSESPRAPRSYISVGALQERLEPLGVRLCVVAACNSGRLFRPQIYKRLNPQPGDPLFLPPTAGIINSSPGFDPAQSHVIMMRRAASNIDSTSEGLSSELSPVAQTLLGLRGDAALHAAARTAGRRVIRFVVSNTLIQLLLHDPPIQLTTTGYAEQKSRDELADAESDALFDKLVSFINHIAERQYQTRRSGSTHTAPAHQ
jgi:hypothetical protein